MTYRTQSGYTNFLLLDVPFIIFFIIMLSAVTVSEREYVYAARIAKVLPNFSFGAVFGLGLQFQYNSYCQ